MFVLGIFPAGTPAFLTPISKSPCETLMLHGLLDGLRRLSVGFVLLIVAAAILLGSDLRSRRGSSSSGKGGVPAVRRIAVVQHASIKALEDGRIGAMEQLQKRGYVEGEKVVIKQFNAEGDIGTANAIAKEVTSGEYDLIISISTPSLQTVASANKSSNQVNHVFGLVTDPYAAGVGIDPDDHLKHPPYMTGFGSMQPVAEMFTIMREMRPELKRIGLVWNPAEANSFAQTKLARSLCEKMSLELVEGSAENSSAVQEAAKSVIARGVDVMWISGDITVQTALTSVVRAAEQAGIPVFSSLPAAVYKGTTLDLGADYVSIGRALGDLAADVMDGMSPASVPVENKFEEVLLFNETTLPKLKERWTLTPAIRKRAAGWVTATETKVPPNLNPGN